MTAPIASFRTVPRTGVIYVMAEAQRVGYAADDASWCNLGQGQPETGWLEGAPRRIEHVHVRAADLDYAPVAGLWELREAVASFYNTTFRRGMPSRYSAENVSISGGGRVALMRACAALSQVHLGHFLPDYTAYEELLDVFRRFTPIPILLDPKRGYAFPLDELEREITGRGLGALLLSNPCNPTGKVLHGDELAEWVRLARNLNCTMMFDEAYSHYIWSKNARAMSSAAEFVEDVDQDPVVIMDGLTKNWRYPGWRLFWTVGPKRCIEAVASAGSFLDGGGSRPIQQAATELVNSQLAEQETEAIRRTFLRKRDLLVDALEGLGFGFDLRPEGTFYAWADVSQLPPSLNTGEKFFRAALADRIICVPGEFFDVDPGKRRFGRESRFTNHVRFSYGPEEHILNQAIERLTRLINGHAKA